MLPFVLTIVAVAVVVLADNVSVNALLPAQAVVRFTNLVLIPSSLTYLSTVC